MSNAYIDTFCGSPRFNYVKRGVCPSWKCHSEITTTTGYAIVDASQYSKGRDISLAVTEGYENESGKSICREVHVSLDLDTAKTLRDYLNNAIESIEAKQQE